MCEHLLVCKEASTQAKGKPHTCCNAGWLAPPAWGLCWRPPGQQATAPNMYGIHSLSPFPNTYAQSTYCVHALS